MQGSNNKTSVSAVPLSDYFVMWDEIKRLPETGIAQYELELESALKEFGNENHTFASGKALKVIQSITNAFPESKEKMAHQRQVLNDFRTYPLWEAGVLTIRSYVPFPDVDYMSHQNSVTMSRLLLQSAAQSLSWLQNELGGFVVSEIR